MCYYNYNYSYNFFTIITIIIFIFGIIIDIILPFTANIIIIFRNPLLTANKIAVHQSKQAKYYICIAVVCHSRTSINCMVSLVSLKSVLFQKHITVLSGSSRYTICLLDTVANSSIAPIVIFFAHSPIIESEEVQVLCLFPLSFAFTL